MQQDSDNNKTLAKIFNSTTFLIVLCLVAVFMVFIALRSFYEDYMVQQEIERLESKVESLEKEKIQSMKLLDYVASKQFAEKKARKELNLKKKGEKSMVIKNNSEEEKKNKEKKNKVSNPQKWWHYFTNKNN